MIKKLTGEVWKPLVFSGSKLLRNRYAVSSLGRIASYKEEHVMWQIKEGILNSGGNLALHLVGNLKHFVGFILGGIPYTRERDKEFSNKNIPLNELIRSIDETIAAINQTLVKITATDLENLYPQSPLGYDMTVENFLLHLYGHLNYHLGQVNYHRRLMEGYQVHS